MKTVTLDKETYDNMVETIRKAKVKESEKIEELQRELQAVTDGGAFTFNIFHFKETIFTSKEVKDLFNDELEARAVKIANLETRLDSLMNRNLFARILNKGAY